MKVNEMGTHVAFTDINNGEHIVRKDSIFLATQVNVTGEGATAFLVRYGVNSIIVKSFIRCFNLLKAILP